MEKAFLVTMSFTLRIIAKDEEEAIGKAIDHYADNKPYIGYESCENIVEDTEMPYSVEDPSLFDTPIASKEVRKGVIAYKYRNGIINICGEKFVMYSMTDAIKTWRRKNPLR